MKGTEAKLIEFMEGAKKRFIIPVYQRNYDWKTENCKQLYDDLIKVIRYERRSHFFGSIVSVYNPDGRYSEFLVIDGQQRLTTVSLLLLAMYQLLENNVIMPDTPSLAQQIYEDFLVDKYQPAETRMKLKPVKNDQKAFGRLFENDSEHVADSNLTINYNYFYDRIQRAEITIDELFDAVCALEIIDIKLNSDDNPQLIFESLNSTGLALSEGDKIRNLILMGQDPKKQEAYYDKYWNKIEICTNYDVSAFIRDYLSIKQSATPAMNKIYIAFKNYVEESSINVEQLLTDLLSYAKLYRVLLNGNSVNQQLNRCIYRLNRLETTVTRPFFLEVLNLNAQGFLNDDDTEQIFLMTENYLFRRNICDLPTNMLNKIFLILHKDVLRYDGTSDQYLEKLKYTLIAKKERARFPDDTEFADAISTKPVYLMNSKNKIYLLERFENFGTAEEKDIWAHFDCGDYSIEHIMPQHLTPAWVKSLGSDYEMIHETWLHRLANLTLTAYNAKYSNSSFHEKLNMDHGFKDSGIRMNQKIAQKACWGLPEIEERSEDMKQRALKIWPFPVTAFKPAKKQLDTYTLDDDVTLSGRQITRFSYKNTEQPVSSWIDMYQRVLQLLHSEDKSVLAKLVSITDDSADLASRVRSGLTDRTNYIEIEKGIYVWTNTSTQYKISSLRKFFKLYDADPADLVFFLKDEEDAEEGPAVTRYDTRLKYWSYALELIHKAHGAGAFSHVNPCRQNWISGFTGYSGIQICCVANYDSVRVELYLGSLKERNKMVFDYLFLRRSEIERGLNAQLVWNRGDTMKTSKIYIQMNEVSIGNKADWQRMAEFHAVWSRKFYDVCIPYIAEIYAQMGF